MRDQARLAGFDEKKIDSIFAGLNQCHLPGVAVGIAIGGSPVYRKGFGLASMELPVVLSSSIRMRICSITKHFACLAYLLLCEEGKAGIDDPIGRHLPELKGATARATVRQLMGHVSGLRDAKDISLLFSGTGQPVSSDDLFSLYLDIDDCNFEPGTSWSYSNGGYLLLGRAIERIAGQTFEEVLRRRIFDPLGMYDSLVRRWDVDFVPNSASLHTTRSATYDITAAFSNAAAAYEKSYISVATAAEGGIVSTIDDMLRWLAHMRSPRVGSEASWSLMKTPQTLANGTSTGCGLGLRSERYRGVETVSHSGGTIGGNAQMITVPSAGLDVILIANRFDVLTPLLADQILDACLQGLEPVRPATKTSAVTGVFQSPRTGRVAELHVKSGQQCVSIDALGDFPYERGDDGVLRPVGIVRNVNQTLMPRGDAANPDAVQLSDYGNLDELVRVSARRKPDSASIIGNYRSDSTHTDLTILETSAGLRMRTVGKFGSTQHSLEALAEGIWRSSWLGPMASGAILTFDREWKGLRLFSGRTRALPFRRVA